jgi:NADPH-dependent ferric siderophore reductase
MIKRLSGSDLRGCVQQIGIDSHQGYRMSSTITSQPQTSPIIERHRHELVRRNLSVVHAENITPAMRRITLKHDGTHSFVSLAPDDHIKIFLEGVDGNVNSRDFTPRRYSTSDNTIVIDFAVHDAGPAAEWAMTAKPGDNLAIGGPRGSAVISSVNNWLLIGDETALPAIGRRIEELGTGAHVTSVVAITGETERQLFETTANLVEHWITRPLTEASDPAPFLSLLQKLDVTQDTFVWIAAEAKVARAIKAFFLEERKHAPIWLKASGYWLMGQADAHEKLD